MTEYELKVWFDMVIDIVERSYKENPTDAKALAEDILSTLNAFRNGQKKR